MTTGSALHGRTIVITGAGSGIGQAVAQRCAQEGALLALIDRAPGVEQVANDLDALSFVGDVRDASFAHETVRRVVEQLGGLHGLANIAGVQLSGNVVTLEADAWDTTLGVNVTAPFLWTRCAVPVMVEGGGGCIVNVASVAATHAIRNSVAYVTSKHALLGLTRSVAADFGRQGVRCNAVSPGSIETDFLRSYTDANPEAGRRLVDANSTGRLGQPDEVAAWCALLLGPDAGFVNGANIVVDGGRTAVT